MSQRPSEVPDILLEQLLLGELSRDEERALRARLAPEELERRLATLRGADTAFQAEHDHERMLSAITSRARVARMRSEVAKPSAIRYLVPSLAVLALMVWFVRPQPGATPDKLPGPPQDEQIILKGLDPYLVLYRREGEVVETLSHGAHAAAGDMLQVGYVAAEARYGAIVSVDGGGTVTLHFPDAETASSKLTAPGEQLLDHSYELDAAPAFERFFFVTAREPIDIKNVMGAAHALARNPAQARTAELKLPPSLKQASLTLVKE
jgi:hypothetical protein